ncbi:putative pectate lyase 12-like [Dorcoceras hygrometricum]|uniref:Putative pectate lyase 12-like n=1 Tax=Dorcoceras hygrometricum TaxID=472368 RepID=A0A2Z7CC45_9LAMI|nr:putative pectate lyase 12-like [Dorcoceras hygrometricum]
MFCDHYQRFKDVIENSVRNLWMKLSLTPYLKSLCNNYYKLGPSNADLTPAKPNTRNCSRTETQKSNSWELRTRTALYYPFNLTESSKPQISHLLSQTQETAQEPEHRKATAGSYELDQRYTTPLT